MLKERKKSWPKTEVTTISSRGASRGLSTLCDSQELGLVSSTSTQNWIYTDLKNKQSGERYKNFNVYTLLTIEINKNVGIL